ncbi:CPBP family intramembrane glutamic endopeptidase [Robiginitalea sp. IMCC44478]|uniref:CPBP family intramembrane glutamic endopeptidase n=1 Tax=Robiginitalea sp. IMCC44478 TaxID=3459122 RepID=UPI0040428557
MKNHIKTSVGLLGFLAFPFLLQFLSLDLKLFEGAMWLLLVLIVLWIYFVEKRTITSIGWKKLNAKTLFSGIGLGLVVFILFGVLTVAIQTIGLELNRETAELIASQSAPFLLLIALRAAVVEEVLYRGFAFERMYELTNSKWLAGLIPVLIFTLVHYSWGIGHLVFVFFAGSIFMLVYISKRNLPLVIIAHFVTDVIALLVLPLLLQA